MTDKQKLDKILQHTKFSHKTKALWVYYRGGNMQGFDHNLTKVKRLILLNLHLNGSLDQRFMPKKCQHCYARDCSGQVKHKNRHAAIRYVVKQLRPTTIARWKHAIQLIDIALDHEKGKPARPRGY